MNVVITGATKGIGYAIAEKFAEEGNNIFVCSRSENDLLRMKEDFKKQTHKIYNDSKIEFTVLK